MTDEQAEAIRSGKPAEKTETQAEALTTENLNELLSQRTAIETELKSILEKYGFDPDEIKDMKLSVMDNGKQVIVNGLPDEDRFRIASILEKPEHREFSAILGTYLTGLRRVNDELQNVTGLNGGDLRNLMQEGMSLADANNDKLQSLFAEDPGLAGAIESYLKPGQFLNNDSYVRSGKNEASLAMHGLEHAIMTGLKIMKELDLSPEEYKELRENLKVTASSDGTFSVSGTKNKDVIQMIENFAAHYTSGAFADALRHGEVYQSALKGKGQEDMTTTYTISFNEPEGPSTMAQYGNSHSEQLERTMWYNY